MKIARKGLAVILSATFAATMLSGCGQDMSWSAKTNTVTTSVGQYIYYLVNQTQQAEKKLDITSSTVDSDFFDMMIDDQTAKDWIVNEAKKDLKNAIGAEIEFNNLGLVLTGEEESEISDQVENYYSTLEEYYQFSDLGISEDSFETVLTDQKKYDKVFDAYYGAGGSQEVSDQQITDYINSNGASYKEIELAKSSLTPTTGVDGSSDNGKGQAQGYVDEINNGSKSIENVNHDYKIANGTTEEDYTPLEEEYVYQSDEEDSTLPDQVKSALFEQAQVDGPAILVEDDYNFYIVQRYTPSADMVNTQKEDALDDMKDDEFSEQLAQIVDTQNYQENSAVFEKYNPVSVWKRSEKLTDKANS